MQTEKLNARTLYFIDTTNAGYVLDPLLTGEYRVTAIDTAGNVTATRYFETSTEAEEFIRAHQ